MGIEVDFLAVGEESKSGDAISLRYGDRFGPRSSQTVVIIDGGFADTGDELVDHIRSHYNTDRVDLVISTHPDNDHVAGLLPVVKRLDVEELWLHQPWRHSETIARAAEAKFTKTALNEYLERSLSKAQELESVAREQGVPSIKEPFTGEQSTDGCLTVLGPSQDYYKELAAQFPEQETSSPTSTLSRAWERAVSFLEETLDLERLSEDGETSVQNESSVVSLLSFGGRSYLFTGDAGRGALVGALDGGHLTDTLRFVQVPHHGSQRNVTPSILDRLLGGKSVNVSRGTAYVSAARKGEPKHPNKKVTNAFSRRGFKVYATQGNNKWHHTEAPDRSNYSSAKPLPFYDQVEEDED